MEQEIKQVSVWFFAVLIQKLLRVAKYFSHLKVSTNDSLVVALVIVEHKGN